MKKYTLEKLEREVEKTRKDLLKKRKYRYHLCRELGFTPAEAAIMAGKREEVIRELAAERRLKQL